MRVLIAHSAYRSDQPSGENAVVDAEASLLAERGVEVHRLLMHSDDIAGWPARRRAALPARVVWSTDGYRATRAAIERARPDVVHFHNTFPLLSPSALWAARRAGTRVVQTLHNYRPMCPAGTFFRDGRVCEDCLGRVPWPGVRHRCYRGSAAATTPVATMDAVHAALRTRRCVDAFVSPSAFTRAKYVEAGWPGERIHVKYNTAADPGRTREGAGDGFVCLARLAPEKGVDVLLEAWREAFPAGEQTLTIAGSGDSGAALREAHARAPGVRFAGRVSAGDVERLMRGARAVVVPSRWYEVFGRTVIEAYALGVPAVASRIGGLAEIVEHGRTGLLVDPGDRDGLVAALRRLAADPGEAERLGRGARALYRRAFAPDATCDRLLEIYRGAETRQPAALAGAAG